MQKSAKWHAFFSDRMCAVGGLEPKVTVARTLGLLGNVPKTWKLRHYCHCTPIRTYIYIYMTTDNNKTNILSTI